MIMEPINKKKKSSSARSVPSNHESRSIDGGSRASSGKSSTLSASQLTSNSLTDMHKNDNSTDMSKGYDLRAHLAQILTFSDEEEDDYSSDEYSLESFDGEEKEIDEELKRLTGNDDQPQTPKPTESNNCQSLIPIAEENDDLDSEEENEIMKEIREEIKNNVRQEMKSELELYQIKMKKLERQEKIADGEPVDTESEMGDKGLNEDLDSIDPRLKEAIIKMKKLDKILAKRVRREKEVKRDRILLERRIRRELEDLHKENKSEYKEVQTNEQKYLALELPQRHNEGVTVPDEFTGEEVFATQLNEEEYPGLHKSDGKDPQYRTKSRKAKSRTTRTTSRQESEDGESRGDTNSVASGSLDGRGKPKKKGKNFIKRNRELAADAGNVIAMTEEEKKRLDDLLCDMDKIPDIPEDMELDDSNPFQIAIKPGEGFQPDTDELRSLTSIDSRLKEIMPPEDYESIASSALSYAPKNKLFTRTGVKHTIEWETRGEKALFQNAEQREMNERLFAIDQELSRLHNPEEHELDTPRLGEDQLQDLIDQCVTSLSMSNMSRLTLNTDSRTSMADTESIMSHDIDTTIENTPRTLSPNSARRELLDHPPKLAPDVLQKLLSEAYHPLSKELSALQEVDNEDEESTPVPAEVWRLIAMEDEPTAGNNPELQTNNCDVLNTDNLNKNSGYELGGSVGHQSNSRNGYRTISRNSSSSSLTTVSDTVRESCESKPLKLPEIDPTGTLVTQGLNMNQHRLNNHQRTVSNASARTPVNMSRNSFSDSRLDNGQIDSSLNVISIDGEIITPHPPSEKRESSASSNKSRTITPGMKTSIT